MAEAVRLAVESAQAQGASRVHELRLRVGTLSGAVPDALEFAFDAVTAGTLAEHATLTVETVPVRVRCRSCGAETGAQVNRLVCGACDDWQVDVIAGEEMLLTRVEIETEPAPVH